MEGVVDKDRNLEVDTLTDGKPVELIPQHRSDVVELPPVRDQPGCSVEDGLQSSYDNVGRRGGGEEGEGERRGRVLISGPTVAPWPEIPGYGPAYITYA